MIRRVLFLLLTLAWCASADALAVGPYVLTNLGDLPGGIDESHATGINSYGQVVGWGVSDMIHGFLWQPNVANGTTGSLIDLGSLRAGGESYANGINSMGQIVGRTSTDGPNAAYLWTPTSPNGTAGSMSVVGGPPFREGFNWALGVNSYGQVVGKGQIEGAEHPFLWTPDTPNGNSGSMVNLDSVGLFQIKPSAINSYGQVVFLSGLGTVDVWSPDTPNSAIGALTHLPQNAVDGLGINTSGEVVGSAIFEVLLYNSNLTERTHAAIWKPTVPNGTTFSAVDLGALNESFGYVSVAQAINSQGEVVGKSALSDVQMIGGSRAFVWKPDVANGTSGNMFDLNQLLNADTQAHWTLTDAIGINDIGQIVGNGMFDPDGPGGLPAVPRAFLLTVVPEPQTITLLGLILAIAPFGFRANWNSDTKIALGQ